MTDLKTIIPRKIIADVRQDFPQAALRLVIFVAVGGLNQDHPWYPYSARITVGAARCVWANLTTNIPPEFVVVTPRNVLQSLYEMGILDNVEFFREGFVVYQSQDWFNAHRVELETPEQKLNLMYFDAEAALWARSEPKPNET